MTVKVSPKYQVVIPEDVRNALGIKSGSQMEVLTKGRVIYLVPVPDAKNLQQDLAGKINRKNLREKNDRT